MRIGPALTALVLFASCTGSSNPPQATQPTSQDLVKVATRVYPLNGDRYVTCDFGYGGSTRYSNCPVTARLSDRLQTVFAGYVSAPEPLGAGQDPEWPVESITADRSGTGGVAHVVLTKPPTGSSRYDLVIIKSAGKLLVDDVYCTGADRATSSIYVDGWMNRFSC